MNKRDINWLTVNENLLEQSFSNLDFIIASFQQIRLDFAKFNLIIPENTPKNLQSMELMIQLQLDELSTSFPEKLPQLIYTIDLPEAIFKDILANSTMINAELAKCIVVREALKVFLRQKFAGKY